MRRKRLHTYHYDDDKTCEPCLHCKIKEKYGEVNVDVVSDKKGLDAIFKIPVLKHLEILMFLIRLILIHKNSLKEKKVKEDILLQLFATKLFGIQFIKKVMNNI